MMAVHGERIRNDVSLIMTVFNDAQGLPEFLKSIEAQTVLPIQIVIVDGGSKDDTLRVLDNWEAPDGVTKVVRSIPGANTPRGRNAAVERVATPWIAVADAGTELAVDWFERLVEGIAPGVDVVSGWFEPLPGPFMRSTIGAVITPTLDEIDPDRFMPSCRSVAFRTEAWRAVGGQPEWLDRCQDLYMDLVLKKRGYQFVFAPLAISRWDARPSLESLFRQYRGYADGDGRANLWRRRHIVRYVAYALGVGLAAAFMAGLATSPMLAWSSGCLLLVGGVFYMSKFWARVWKRRGTVIGRPLLSLLAAPIIVATGDIAKMVGYPEGLAWRRRHQSIERALEQ